MRFVCVVVESKKTSLVKIKYGKTHKMGTVKSARCFFLPISLNLTTVNISILDDKLQEKKLRLIVPVTGEKHLDMEDDVTVNISTINIDPVHETDLFTLAGTPECSPRAQFASLLAKNKQNSDSRA